jgi:predicted nucleic acid-binding protein
MMRYVRGESKGNGGGTRRIAGPHHWEIGNAFSAMLRRVRATKEQVDLALAAYRAIRLRFVDVELESALEIAHRFGLYAYDAYVLHCGQRFRAPILTLDRALAHVARAMDVRLVEVT